MPSSGLCLYLKESDILSYISTRLENSKYGTESDFSRGVFVLSRLFLCFHLFYFSFRCHLWTTMFSCKSWFWERIASVLILTCQPPGYQCCLISTLVKTCRYSNQSLKKHFSSAYACGNFLDSLWLLFYLFMYLFCLCNPNGVLSLAVATGNNYSCTLCLWCCCFCCCCHCQSSIYMFCCCCHCQSSVYVLEG